MKKYLLIISPILILSFSWPNHLDEFYRMLSEASTVKLKIRLNHEQFESSFESSGYCYLIGPKKYFYESPSLELYNDGEKIITKNYVTKQIIYENINKNQIGIMDVLSGAKEFVKFSNYNENSNRFDFTILDMGLEGYFSFKNKSGHLKSIHLNVGENQFIFIEIFKIELLDVFMPKLEIEDFEILDFRV